MDDRFSIHPLAPVLTLTGIHTLYHFDYAPDFLFTGERHDFWEMAYVESGPVGVMAEATGYCLRPGEAIFHKPNEYHNIWANGAPARVIILSFSCESPAMEFFKNQIVSCGKAERELLAQILELGEQVFEPRLSVCTRETLPFLADARMTLQRDIPFGMEQLLRQSIEAFLIRLIQDAASVPHHERSSDEVKRQNERRIADAVIAFLEEHLHAQVTLDQVCDTVCFSKSYVKRIFHEQTGTSIMAYDTALKLVEAKRLLATTNVTKTAAMLGFSSVHYFSRAFSKLAGECPTAYQKRVGESEH